MRISYDNDTDVIYISFGQPRPAISEETEDGILIRHDPDTNEVIDLTIIDFGKRLSTKSKQVILPIALDYIQLARRSECVAAVA